MIPSKPSKKSLASRKHLTGVMYWVETKKITNKNRFGAVKPSFQTFDMCVHETQLQIR